MKRLLLILTLFFSQAAFTVERTTTLELIGMYCAMCPVTIQTALDLSDGVESVKVSRDPDRAFVTYDDAVTTPDNLVKVVEKAGYEANVLSKTQEEK